ncbi:MAG TPA: 3-methyl-2-oxobutanoate hydroxymethyltransferase [Actinomycetota bacterium]|nr:3-methyl-2-oxobutanoate hydroxymethyltransferase [Actinomycetota bacterium]
MATATNIQRRPTLLHSCARAATAEEARFRIQDPNSTARASRVVALDPGAEAIMDGLTGHRWQGARFLVYEAAAPEEDGAGPDAILRTSGGAATRLSDELEGADVAVMIATTDRGAEAASVIGRAAFRRRIMTAGLVVGGGEEVRAAVNALRPYAAVLVVSADPHYVADVLRALRA